MSALTERRTDVGSGREVIDVTGLPRDKYGWYVVERSINWPGIALFFGLWVLVGLVGWGILQVVLALHEPSDNGVGAGGRKNARHVAEVVKETRPAENPADTLVLAAAQARAGDLYRVEFGDCSDGGATVYPDPSKPDKPVAGCFHSDRPDTLFLDSAYFQTPEKRADLGATVQDAQRVTSHELAHAVTFDTCATTDPEIAEPAEVGPEVLADSMAWYYLGMPYRHAYVGSPYGVTVDGVHVAMAIYEQGLCGGQIPEEIAARPTGRAY